MKLNNQKLSALRELREWARELAARILLARRRGEADVRITLDDAETAMGAALEASEGADDA